MVLPSECELEFSRDGGLDPRTERSLEAALDPTKLWPRLFWPLLAAALAVACDCLYGLVPKLL